MENVKNYFSKNSEQVFALAIMWTMVSINHFLPYKLVFLNSFFLVILLATYYLEVKKAVLGSVLAALLVVIHVYSFPSYFILELTELDLWMTVLAWSSMLVLTGAIVGKLISQLKRHVKRLEKANRELENQLLRAEEWASMLADLSEDKPD